MPFIDPLTVSDPTAGQPGSAAWGDAVRAAAVYLASLMPRCRAYRTTAFSHTTTATWMSVPFTAERFDVGAMHSTSTDTSRITIPAGEGGAYLVGGSASFATNVTGRRLARILLNNVDVLVQDEFAVTGGESGGSLVTLWPMAAGDYIELQVYQSSGGALDVVTTAAPPEFWAIWQASL